METIELHDFAPLPPPPPKDVATLPPTTIPAEPTNEPTNFWSRHIRLTISEAASRDHLALERTFLAYVRTASAYAQFGVTMAQLFRLNISHHGFQTPTTLKIAKGLGATTEVIAIVVILIGATYFMKQQSGIVKGVVMSRGSDVGFIALVSFALFAIILGLLAAADQW